MSRAVRWIFAGGGEKQRKVNAIFGARALRAAAREASRAGFTVLVADELLGLRRRSIVADAPRLRRARDAAIAMAKVLSDAG